MARTTRIPGRETLENGEKLMEAISLINDISKLERPFDLVFFLKEGTIICDYVVKNSIDENYLIMW